MLALARNVMLATAILFLAAYSPTAASAATVDLPDGAKLDLSSVCPVCNMKVESAAAGPAAIVFKDGKVVGFDGTGDFFRYLLAQDKYKFNPAEIKDMYVTDQSSKKFVEAKKAFYVVGSDLTDHGGPSVAPFSAKEDAEKFKTERHGANVVSFDEVKLRNVQGKKKRLKMHTH